MNRCRCLEDDKRALKRELAAADARVAAAESARDSTAEVNRELRRLVDDLVLKVKKQDHEHKLQAQEVARLQAAEKEHEAFAERVKRERRSEVRVIDAISARHYEIETVANEERRRHKQVRRREKEEGMCSGEEKGEMEGKK